MSGDPLGARPLADDPSAADVVSMLTAGTEWLKVSVAGEYSAFAAEVMQADGSNWQEVVALTIPARRNKTRDIEPLHVFISPEDALGIAEVLEHSAKWMIARRS